jgi:competence protein ComEA
MLKTLIAVALAFCAAAAFAAADINKASLAELEAVKGIGPVAAAKIVDERKKGSFKDWADVMQRMRGIKDARAARLSDAGLTVNGEVFHAGAGGTKKSDVSAKFKKVGKEDGADAKVAKK